MQILHGYFIALIHLIHNCVLLHYRSIYSIINSLSCRRPPSGLASFLCWLHTLLWLHLDVSLDILPLGSPSSDLRESHTLYFISHFTRSLALSSGEPLHTITKLAFVLMADSCARNSNGYFSAIILFHPLTSARRFQSLFFGKPLSLPLTWAPSFFIPPTSVTGSLDPPFLFMSLASKDCSFYTPVSNCTHLFDDLIQVLALKTKSWLILS